MSNMVNDGVTSGVKSPWRRSLARVWLFRCTAILLGVFVALIVAEISLRLIGYEPERLRGKRVLIDEVDPSVVYHCYPDNPNGEFDPAPDVSRGEWRLRTYSFEADELPLKRLSETPWAVRYDYSSKMIREREIELSPTEGVVRLAVVGDSFVFGEGVPNDHCLPRLLEHGLGDACEVINAGVVGHNTEDEVQLLYTIAAEAGCRRAVFVFIPNDIVLTPELNDRQGYINDLINVREEYLNQHQSANWYSGRLRVIDLLGSSTAMRRFKAETVQWYLDSYDPQQNGYNLMVLEQAIQALAVIPDCKVAFVLYPLMTGLEDDYPLAPIHDVVATMARSAELPVLDLAPAFRGQKTRALWVSETDHHPNGRAHQIAATAIQNWLERDLPGFLTPEQADADDQPGTASLP